MLQGMCSDPDMNGEKLLMKHRGTHMFSPAGTCQTSFTGIVELPTGEKYICTYYYSLLQHLKQLMAIKNAECKAIIRFIQLKN